jgi:hypothetical protein
MKFLDVPQVGSWAGVTHQRSRAGQVRRNRRAPVQPLGTGRRSLVRQNFSTASAAWRGLSASNQQSWIAYAANNPRTDRLGQVFKLTGHQMYVSAITSRLAVGQPAYSSAPVSHSIFSAKITAFSHVYATGNLTLTFSSTASSGDFLLVAVSRWCSAGVSFPPPFWQAGVVAGNATSLSGIATLVTNQFGNMPPGWRMFAKITPCSAYGVLSPHVIASCIGT